MDNKNGEKVITRFAPSPTGVLHVGSARTALFNYLFAKNRGGKIILRIEDTDKERSKGEYEDDIKEGLDWLGISFDEEYRQSERIDIHKKYLKKLIDDGHAYVSKEEPKEEGQRSEVIRFKNPNKEITFHDEIRGDIAIDTTDLKDFIIAKDLDTPLYNFVVVVDDAEMGVTHVIRGEDGISNTPRQILIIDAIGAQIPTYAHIPLILAPDKSKLSKRHGAVSVLEYRDKGYLPEAMVNFLALIGWNPGDERELFSMDELIQEFDLKKVQKGGAVFNVEKLDWTNKEYIKKYPEGELLEQIHKHLPERITRLDSYSKDVLKNILTIITERINVFSDIKKMVKDGELDYYFTQPKYESEKLVWKDSSKDETKKYLEKIIELLESADFENADSVKSSVWDYATEEGRGSVLWPMRYALSGRDKSPDPFTLASVLGKEETVRRLQIAVQKLI